MSTYRGEANEDAPGSNTQPSGRPRQAIDKPKSEANLSRHRRGGAHRRCLPDREVDGTRPKFANSASPRKHTRETSGVRKDRHHHQGWLERDILLGRPGDCKGSDAAAKLCQTRIAP